MLPCSKMKKRQGKTVRLKVGDTWKPHHAGHCMGSRKSAQQNIDRLTILNAARYGLLAL
jgi:hypothetical protein